MNPRLLCVPPYAIAPYSGVVLELEYPSRFDTKELCSGSAAFVLKEAFGATGMTRYNCEIRTRAYTEPYPKGTKVVLLCGEKALAKLGHPPEKLNALRGSPFKVNDIVYIPTYHPQQCADRANYEHAFNPAAQDTGEDASSDNDSDESSVKDMGRTARRNYRFWFIHDLRKALRISREGFRPNQATYCTNLTVDGILSSLRLTTQSTPFYLDIETNPATGQMICFAWSNDEKIIYVAPILKVGGELAFPEPSIHLILRELCLAMGRASVVVAHNALFDLFILAWRYKILPPKQAACYDTMVAHARIHVDTEKSLGHCTSLYTLQPYHKDEGIFNPSNYTQWQQLLTYNAKDVETTALVHQAQCALAARDRGLAASIAQGNALVRPLLLKSLRGLYINKDELCQRIDNLSKRIAFVEEKILPPLACGATSFNPRSPKQVAELLYEKLSLPKSTDPTVSITGKDALYRLALKFPLPILRGLLHVRTLSKERGTYGARLWRDSHITCAYVITGTKTFRLSSRKLLGVWGTNLQNWSKKMRALVKARPGCVLVQVDQSGAEALIVAYLAPAGRYRDLFIHKVSPHVYFGLFAFPEVWKAELGYDISYLYPMSIAQVKADPKWPEISKCIKASDNNPPARRYYYFQKQINHCVKAGYKVLTPSGWVPIESNPGTIACCDRVGDSASFQEVLKWNNSAYIGELINVSGKEFEQAVTPNHTIVYWSNNKSHVIDADTYAYRFSGSSIKVSTTLTGDGIENSSILGLVIALQADGHIHKNSNRWTFRFAKEHKINRLRNFLLNLNIKFIEDSDTDGYIKITVWPDSRIYKYLNKETKQFNLAAFLSLCVEARNFICAEVFRWDGTDESYMSGHQTVYRTTNKHNAEVIHSILRLSGHGSVMSKLADYYTVTRNVRMFSRTVQIERVQYNGTVHCPTTTTGFFLVMSQNGKISITGNSSNYDIKATRFAANLLEKSEGQVSLPVHECDRLLGIYHKLYPEIREGFQAYVRNELFKHRILRNLFGYPRRFYGWLEGDATILKDAYSWVPQSTVGCITGIADSTLQESIDAGKLDMCVLGNCHDSLLVECPSGTEVAASKAVMTAMNVSMTNPLGETFSMRSEATYGPSWYEQYNF